MTDCRGDPRAGGPVRAITPPELPAPLELVALTALMARTTGRPELVVSLATGHGQAPLGGTSVAAPLVTGAVALLWSLFPAAGVAEMRWAVSDAALRRRAVGPPVLDAAGAHRRLAPIPR
ncbi:S8 family serine peptidase [Kitasatospora sp. NPDC050463]|uniref:S8 family serine peptidase n=1 Tax=Kitasatospora sp. NPDC050463 TaxID=3155786 RepID=UPI0033CF5858